MSTRLLCDKCQVRLRIDPELRIGGTAELARCEHCTKLARCDEFPRDEEDGEDWSPERERARYG